LSEPPIFAG
jgi:succinate dehydrogenase cytochrome b556 subunit